MKSSMMNSNLPIIELVGDDDDDESTTIDDDTSEDNNNQRTGTHSSRLSQSSVNVTNSTANSTIKRQKDISPCYVCGAKAHGYNFDQITCESCKAFFRRNALKSMDRFRCRNNNKCTITTTTRKRCKRCRLAKCFNVGMRKEWILTEEEKRLKRKKIERNRLMKQQALLVAQKKQQIYNEVSISNSCSKISGPSTHELSSPSNDCQRQLAKRSLDVNSLPLPLMCMYPPSDQHLYERHRCLLKQLSEGYQFISQQHPQPQKFAYRNILISQTTNIESKTILVKDLTRELTQMTTSRLLHYFNLIPEFRTMNDSEKRGILMKNMLTVFMFHGALTYNADNDTFVDHSTGDQPFNAKYLLLVYGPRVYNNFIALARRLTSAAYQSLPNKESDERTHMLFLLLMIVLLFTDRFDYSFDMLPNEHQSKIALNSSNSLECHSLSTATDSASSRSSISPTFISAPTSRFSDKLQKIQQIYVEMACRYLHDEFGLAIGRQMFHNLLPLLLDLHKLCSTLANVNLCEFVEEDDQNLSSSWKSITAPATTINMSSRITTFEGEHRSISLSSLPFNPTMISDRCHLNELQKENRAPPPSNNSLASILLASRQTLTNPNIAPSTSSFILSDTIPTFENY